MHGRRRFLRLRAAGYCLASGILATPGVMSYLISPAAAQSDDASTVISFDIPVQPLDTALAAYFRSTGVQLLYDSAVTAGRLSAAVRGRYPPREALRIMLASTGLRVRYSKSNAAIIVTAAATGASPLIPLGRVVIRERVRPARIAPLDRIAYYDVLERTLRARLQATPDTGRLSFRIVLAMEIDAIGQIETVRVDRTSGNRQSDALIVAALRTFVVPRPPDGLDQPLLIALTGTRRD